MQSDRGPAEPDARESVAEFLPRALVALAGACSVSGIAGFAALAAGREAPPLWLLLLPPAVVAGWGVSHYARRVQR